MINEQYSGDNSREFWALINSLPENKQQELYTLGCVLQMVEGFVIRVLNAALEDSADE